MSGERKVIPIGEAPLRRAEIHSAEAVADVEELTSVTVGKRRFVAERARVHGRNLWRIRLDGTSQVITFEEPGAMNVTFGSLAGADPGMLEEWFAAETRPE